MKSSSQLCPVAFYVGQRCMAYRRANGQSQTSLAAQLECGTHDIRVFEQGNKPVDVLLLLRIERCLGMRFRDYQPPVCYFGFLGLTASSHAMLYKAKAAVLRVKQSFRHVDVRHEMEHALLKVRYSPLRGPRADIS